MGQRRSGRELALKMLYQMEIGKSDLHEVTRRTEAEFQGAPESLEFARELVALIDQHRDELNQEIERFASGWTLDRMASIDRNLLRMAMGEMRYRDDIPCSVSINEAVQLAKIYSTADSGKFVNGILGNFARSHGLSTRPPTKGNGMSFQEETKPITPADLTGRVISGTDLAARVRAEVAAAIKSRLAQGKSRPGLATVLVGEDPASQTYIRGKEKACREVGVEFFGHYLPASISQGELEGLIARLNADPQVHGILVQLPLPPGLNEERVLRDLRPDKDVDGFHPANLGLLCMKDREPPFTPGTPAGCLALLDEAGTSIEGARAVVLGRSHIVGMPAALLLIRRNATVTVCHSRTKDLPEICLTADILLVAVGRAEMVRGDWIKPGATVIDVGMNRIPDASRKSGNRLVGDVCFEEARQVAGALTPVPGGVGPMTIAMLLRNTLRAVERHDGPA